MEEFTSTLILPFVFLPFLVVISRTPLAPSAPYNAEAAPPFETEIDSTSFVLISIPLFELEMPPNDLSEWF